MDYLRVLLVPFHPTILIMVAALSVLLSVLTYVGLYGSAMAGILGGVGSFLILVWLLKYCYVLVEHLADGEREPPVMSMEMLSPFEIRPWAQAAFVAGGAWLCWQLDAPWNLALGVVLLALLPASIAVLGAGGAYWEAANPWKLALVAKGLGPAYVLILAAVALELGIAWVLLRLDLPHLINVALLLLMIVAVFALIGASLFERRRALGLEPRRSPERVAERAENERIKLREKMVDEVFQQVRIGRHVDATAPLARWLSDADGDVACRDSFYVAERALRWDSVAALGPIASTLVRHLLRAGRPDAALAVFEQLRTGSAALTMDSAHDLRTLAEYAENIGREELAASLRLETPVHHPGT